MSLISFWLLDYNKPRSIPLTDFEHVFKQTNKRKIESIWWFLIINQIQSTFGKHEQTKLESSSAYPFIISIMRTTKQEYSLLDWPYKSLLLNKLKPLSCGNQSRINSIFFLSNTLLISNNNDSWLTLKKSCCASGGCLLSRTFGKLS